MTLSFLELSGADRHAAFVEAAARSGVSAVMIEKDFWVCWLLDVTFSQVGIGQHLVFKGGTSLSKVYAVIERFSEDVDLSLSPELIGWSETSFDGLSSRTQRDQAMLSLQERSSAFVRDQLAPLLEAAIVERIGPPSAWSQWLEFEEESPSQSPALHFRYPSVRLEGFEYIRRAIKLELGSLTDQQPVGRHPIRPLVAEHFPSAFEDWRCEVTALELARTFWEKATICTQSITARQALFCPSVTLATTQTWLACSSIRREPSSSETPSSAGVWSNGRVGSLHVHGRATISPSRGTFRLTPAVGRIGALATDYALMRSMFFGQPRPFDELLNTLANAEETLNAFPP